MREGGRKEGREGGRTFPCGVVAAAFPQDMCSKHRHLHSHARREGGREGGRTFACGLVAATVPQNVINLALGVISIRLGVEAGVSSNEGEEGLVG
jgi:hypothetical protein